MRPYYQSTTVNCSIQDAMKMATADTVSCEIDASGSVIVSSTYAEQTANAALQIKVNMMNPFRDFTCATDSTNVF